jgi:predicted aconitase with swiveling domain/8-oxo-dGTP pyrophosphatase MutT (NUDIX family)
VSRGRGEGRVLLLDKPFSFLGGVDVRTGDLSKGSGGEGGNVKGRVFVFPNGRGSTVGSYTILQMKREGTLPAAIVNTKAETIVATGAVMANLPMVDSVDISLLLEGDRAVVDGAEGTVELPDVHETQVVTAMLRHGEKVLILKRSDKVRTNKRMWAGVSGYIEPGETPPETAVKEVGEETAVQDARLVRKGEVISVRIDDTVWRIHPFLFDVKSEAITIDWEHTEYAWVRPSEIAGYRTVRGLGLVLDSLSIR